MVEARGPIVGRVSAAAGGVSSRAAETVATLVLAGLGVAIGSFLGALYLIYVPDHPVRPIWSAVCAGLVCAPIAAAFAALGRILKGRSALWVPLVGVAAIVALMFAIVVLEAGIRPPYEPSFR